MLAVDHATRGQAMKFKTPERREYYAKYERVLTENDANGWFETYRLPGNVLGTCEVQHLQEVNHFIILGSERSLVLDAGLGIVNSKPLIDELCPNGYQVINCHRHFDHAGNNWHFDEVLHADEKGAIEQARTGVAHMYLANQSDPDMFVFDYPEGFDPDAYWIRPFNGRTVEDGHIFDLGDRKVEVVYTPGHTEDHLMLYDHAFDILFSGDMVYLDVIYAQFGNDIMGHSDIDAYIASLDKISERFPDVRYIYTSHNDFSVPVDSIGRIREALVAVRDGTAQGEPLHDEKFGYYDDPETMKEYMFGDFSIVYRE